MAIMSGRKKAKAAIAAPPAPMATNPNADIMAEFGRDLAVVMDSPVFKDMSAANPLAIGASKGKGKNVVTATQAPYDNDDFAAAINSKKAK